MLRRDRQTVHLQRPGVGGPSWGSLLPSRHADPRGIPSICLSLTLGPAEGLGGRAPQCVVPHQTGTFLCFFFQPHRYSSECGAVHLRGAGARGKGMALCCLQVTLPQSHEAERPSTDPCSRHPSPRGHRSLLCGLQSSSAEALV